MRKLIIVLTFAFLVFIFINNYKIFNKANNFFSKKISKIEVSNLNYLNKNFILQKLYIKEGDSVWKFNVDKLKSNLDIINEIESYNFRLKKNGKLEIFIKEKKPHMVWTFSNKQKIIDKYGKVLNFSGVSTNNMVEVTGYLNKDNFFDLNSFLDKKKEFTSTIEKIHYEENIGWKFFLSDQTCLYAPDKKVNEVIEVFEKIKKSKVYFKYRYYDMRIFERIYLEKKNKCLTS